MVELTLYCVAALAFGTVAVFKLRDGDRAYAAIYALVCVLTLGSAIATWGMM